MQAILLPRPPAILPIESMPVAVQSGSKQPTCWLSFWKKKNVLRFWSPCKETNEMRGSNGQASGLRRHP